MKDNKTEIKNILRFYKEYELTEVLPKEFASSLPTIEMIESEFSKIERGQDKC